MNYYTREELVTTILNIETDYTLYDLAIANDKELYDYILDRAEGLDIHIAQFIKQNS